MDNKNGKIVINENCATNIKGVFAGGDAVNGGKEVVDAVQAGKDGAAAILNLSEYFTQRRKVNKAQRMISENDISKLVVDLCFKVHTQYGPGLFESVYEEIFCYEWEKTGIPFLRQHPVPLIHEAVKMDIGFQSRCNYR
ncbi:MAG: GxxExxY protein [Chitinophagaceae bacterium]